MRKTRAWVSNEEPSRHVEKTMVISTRIGNVERDKEGKDGAGEIDERHHILATKGFQRNERKNADQQRTGKAF
jgi:hypothetical protein